MKNEFLKNSDLDLIDGPPRELVGYGEHPPVIRWANDARVAVNFVVNLEEGSELTYAMGDETNEEMHELPFHQNVSRDLAKESFFEYGSRAGIWRLLRIFDKQNVDVTVFASAVALERNEELANKIRSSNHDVVGHGYRWSNHFDMSLDEERAVISAAASSLKKTTGASPIGWYCREMSVNTRKLLIEHGGFLYDSDNYSDDLPYWTAIDGCKHLIVPYSLTTNDCRYILGTGFAKPEDFVDTVVAGIKQLRDDNDNCGRMISIGLHPRISGHPSRAYAVEKIIRYCNQLDDVVTMRRNDIARRFISQIE